MKQILTDIYNNFKNLRISFLKEKIILNYLPTREDSFIVVFNKI